MSCASVYQPLRADNVLHRIGVFVIKAPHGGTEQE